MHTYLKRRGMKTHKYLDDTCLYSKCQTAHSSRNKNTISSARQTLGARTLNTFQLESNVNVICAGCLHWRESSSQCILVMSHKRQQSVANEEQRVQKHHHLTWQQILSRISFKCVNVRQRIIITYTVFVRGVTAEVFF